MEGSGWGRFSVEEVLVEEGLEEAGFILCVKVVEGVSKCGDLEVVLELIIMCARGR